MNRIMLSAIPGLILASLAPAGDGLFVVPGRVFGIGLAQAAELGVSDFDRDGYQCLLCRTC